MVRMRTAAQAYQELKQVDPKSCITERQIRELMKSGKIPVVKVGNRIQVNSDILIDYFANPAIYEK